jgi:hypothetical protein
MYLDNTIYEHFTAVLEDLTVFLEVMVRIKFILPGDQVQPSDCQPATSDSNIHSVFFRFKQKLAFCLAFTA